MQTIIESILSQPTAPFCESWVKRACLFFCESHKLPYFEDSMGNIWVNAKNSRQVKNASLVFVAHMDHPGMVIKKFSKSKNKIFAHAVWLGGGPKNIRGFPVQIFSDVNALMVFDGIVKKHTTTNRGPDKALIEVTASKLSSLDGIGLGSHGPSLAQEVCTTKGFKALGPWGACLWYRKAGVSPGVMRQNGKWVTKGADDLAGVCALLQGLSRVKRKPSNVVMLLTRSEEPGFHGALYVLRKRMLDPQKTVVVSVETSSQLPGATLGNGPVIRLGDRATMFDPRVSQYLRSAAASLASRDSSFKFQRRVMDGGTCEASAFNCYGFSVGGISTPLENYHNVSSGGTPVPEKINATDVERLAKLITYLVSTHRPSDFKNLKKTAFEPLKKMILENHTKQMREFWNCG